jgi:hypothetical protein
MTERPPPNDARPVRDRAPIEEARRAPSPDAETCDWCGSTDVWWHHCKLLCRGCNAIVKSCADL